MSVPSATAASPPGPQSTTSVLPSRAAKVSLPEPPLKLSSPRLPSARRCRAAVEIVALGTAVELVVAGAARIVSKPRLPVDAVDAAEPVDGVVAGTGDDPVAALGAVDRLTARRPGNARSRRARARPHRRRACRQDRPRRRRSGPAVDRVGDPVLGVDLVVAVAGVDRVRARPGVDHVGAAAALDLIVAGAAADQVRVVLAEQAVVLGVSAQGVVAGAAPQLVLGRRAVEDVWRRRCRTAGSGRRPGRR